MLNPGEGIQLALTNLLYSSTPVDLAAQRARDIFPFAAVTAIAAVYYLRRPPHAPILVANTATHTATSGSRKLDRHSVAPVAAARGAPKATAAAIELAFGTDDAADSTHSIAIAVARLAAAENAHFVAAATVHALASPSRNLHC